jgi:aspartyl-tRNA(Asn)/glutamyl-tRNA(Gln) amidotransferase subunit A
LAPARQDARLYKVGAVLEKLLENKWSKTMLDFAPKLEVN